MATFGPTSSALSSQRSVGVSQGIGQQSATNYGIGSNQSASQTYIPTYSQEPILNSIAQQAQSMAQPVYDWGMGQYQKNQGNIDQMMQTAKNYASPERISQDVGMAEAGQQQAGEAGRLSAMKDLQSYGVDPSSGRYADLDSASRVQSAAAAAGAGNVQREADINKSLNLEQAAQGLSEQNYQQGYGAANAANSFLSTGMQLKYPPLGQTSSSSGSQVSGGSSTGYNTSSSANESMGGSSQQSQNLTTVENKGVMAEGGPVSPTLGYAGGGDTGGEDATTGGFVSNDLSPTRGAQTDDVRAQLNAGEFVIPKDVAAWKGQEFFYKLMAQARTMRAKAGSGGQQQLGYGAA